MSIPDPPSPLTAPQYAVLPPGAVLHRVHLSAYRAAEFNPGLGGPTRFAPVRDGAGNPVPSLYASATVRSAIHETIFHDIPANAAFKTVRLDDVRRRFDLAMLFITHDLRVAAQICDRIAVMYRGEVVEEGLAAEVFRQPRHDYTRALFDAAPGRDFEFGRFEAA